ncbi:hypothetical protein A2U01_0071395 [Trifolium medium]|uniref:Uncharacterized protein n=1 Tax=Trifolium medium TaxID=97028 RepID=A0A392SMP3_9FABA|nr:hypothetical protein [Trifolium medium]
MLGATRSVILLRAFLFLVPAQRAEWLAQCAAGVGVVLFSSGSCATQA